MLQAGRQRHGLSLEQVAAALNLSVTLIQALENEDWERIVAPVFVVGYLRSYARLLSLDAESLLAGYNRDSAVAANLGAQPELNGQWRGIGRWKLVALASAAVLVVIAVVAWLQLGRWGDAPDEAVASPPPPLKLEAQHSPGSPRQHLEQSPPAVADLLDPEVGDAGGEPLTSVQADGIPLEAGSPQLLERTVRITPEGVAELGFEFSSNCSVEVRNAEGISLFSTVGSRGERLRLLGEGPFHLKLGYAAGVVLTFNGELVPLAQHARNQRATLVLGG